MVGIDLPKLVNNHIKACSLVNTLIGGNLFFLEVYIEEYIQLPEGTKQYNIKLTQTEHQLVHQRSEFVTSSVYIHTYIHVRTRWPRSIRKQSVPGTLSLAPPCLGTRLRLHKPWKQEIWTTNNHYRQHILHTRFSQHSCVIFTWDSSSLIPAVIGGKHVTTCSKIFVGVLNSYGSPDSCLTIDWGEPERVPH